MKNRITWIYMSQSYSGIRPRWFRTNPVRYIRSIDRGINTVLRCIDNGWHAHSHGQLSIGLKEDCILSVEGLMP
jgi:hypothetical protein